MTSSSLTETLAAEIRTLHNGIVSSLRRNVQDAIKIGELLTKAKADLPHGRFIPWVRSELPFSMRTADKYRDIYEYRTKIASSANLQEAYRIVEQIEAPEKQQKQQKRQEPAAPHEAVVDTEPVTPGKNGGQKTEPPEEQKANPSDFRARMDRKAADAREPQTKPATSRDEVDDLLRRADEQIREMQEAAARFSHLTLSGAVDNEVQGSMLDLLQRYVMSFEPAARRVEVAHNLIKAIRVIIHEVNGEETPA